MNRFICIHAHFYQPPRENPWLNDVELQPTAYPYHDWNERITAECYAPNCESRILDTNDRIIDIINNYSRISFNFGPTLLEWMEKNSPDVYDAILKADALSRERFSGHGSALAQVYNHIIMPLANERDKQTQVIWGLRDFEARFKRKPEGMWLSETAVDTPTLEVLAEHGIKFTVLSPYQVKCYRSLDEEEWTPADGGKIDPKNSYLCKLPSGRQIHLFFYDGPISQGVAFEKLLHSGENFANRLLGPLDKSSGRQQLMHIATDGETYGHHHPHGEMALSYALNYIEKHDLANLSIYGEFLEKFPTQYEVQILEDTSWSCAHGIERWRSNCGCHSGMNSQWHQKWRAPLRNAFDLVRDHLVLVYEEGMKAFSDDPWKVRNAYIEVIMDRNEENITRFIHKHTRRGLSHDEMVTFLKLQEMQYHTMLMYTSCGWFFDEVTGIESMQDIFYAARAIQLANEVTGHDFEKEFVRMLERTPSNNDEYENAATAYWKFVKPAVLDLVRVGGHFAISSLFEDYPEESSIYSFSVKKKSHIKLIAGKQKIVIGTAVFQSNITWERQELSYAMLHLGEHNLFGGIRHFNGDEIFQNMQQEITDAFQVSNTYEMLLLMDKHFGTHSYSFYHLFTDVQKKILDIVMESTLAGVEGLFHQVYENNYQFIQAIRRLKRPIPKPLKIMVDFSMNVKLRKTIEKDEINVQEMEQIIEEAKRFDIEYDKPTLAFVTSKRITKLAEALLENPRSTFLLEELVKFLKQVNKLPLELDLWKAQNIVYKIHTNLHHDMHSEPEEKWMQLFNKLCLRLNMKL